MALFTVQETLAGTNGSGIWIALSEIPRCVPDDSIHLYGLDWIVCYYENDTRQAFDTNALFIVLSDIRLIPNLHSILRSSF